MIISQSSGGRAPRVTDTNVRVQWRKLCKVTQTLVKGRVHGTPVVRCQVADVVANNALAKCRRRLVSKRSVSAMTVKSAGHVNRVKTLERVQHTTRLITD